MSKAIDTLEEAWAFYIQDPDDPARAAIIECVAAILTEAVVINDDEAEQVAFAETMDRMSTELDTLPYPLKEWS